MAAVCAARVAVFVRRGTDAATAAEKGKALEDLICYIFETVPGISVTQRNTLNTFDTEEIDVAFWNERRYDGLPFLADIILVECKNWSAPVSSQEVAWFDRKLADRGMGFGVLIAANGITGNGQDRTAAHSVIAGALRERRQIVVVTLQEIEGLAHSRDLVALIKKKLCQLAVAGSLFY